MIFKSCALQIWNFNLKYNTIVEKKIYWLLYLSKCQHFYFKDSCNKNTINEHGSAVVHSLEIIANPFIRECYWKNMNENSN